VASLLQSQGEAFDAQELDEFFSAAVDPLKGVIFFKSFASLLAHS